MRKYAWLALTFLIALPLSADDGAASIGVGGIILMKREPRITMAKELLQVGADDIIVDYDFRNDSDDDITTEVAFPVPSYSFGEDERSPKEYVFDDFKLWINQQPTKYAVEARAFVGKHEVTDLLKAMRVDIPSFGSYQNPAKPGNFGRPTDGHSLDIDRLTQVQRNHLIAANAISTDKVPSALWRVETKFHWTQTFPAHQLTHIRHEYAPVLGNSNTIGDIAHFNPKSETDAELASTCPSPALLRTLGHEQKFDQAEGGMDNFSLTYVDFILTTANTWKTPIEDFTLIVERPHFKWTDKSYVSFCWDGPVTKVDDDHFSAHIDGLVPNKELRVGYILKNKPR
jgi:hypothetical protein